MKSISAVWPLLLAGEFWLVPHLHPQFSVVTLQVRLQMSAARVLRDPIHNLISFRENEVDQLLVRLIDTPEFQRLRRVRQLGFSELVFPGATHTRFAHSIGVMHVARRMLEKLNTQTEISEEERRVVICAALLHDLGHGPFSHAFESVTRIDHERRTQDIITQDGTSVNAVLREVDDGLPDAIGRFFEKDPEVQEEGSFPKFLVQVVTSQLDADRSDYLLRDSYSTGTEYGRFDLEWVLDHLRVDREKDFIYLDSKSLPVAEQYVFARYHMYYSVYFHRATRAAEVMLRLLFKRYQELCKAQGDPTASPVAGVSNLLHSAFVHPDAMSLQEYLTLDDYEVYGFMHACSRADDLLLKRLSTGLLERKLLKGKSLPMGDQAKPIRFATEVREAVQRVCPDFGYLVQDDTVADTGYKPYDPTDESPAAQIFVQDDHGRPRPLERLSPAVHTLTEKLSRLRYYYPSEVKDEVDDIYRRFWPMGS